MTRTGHRFRAIVSTEMRLFFIDPMPIILLVVMPFIVAVFLRQTLQPSVQSAGSASANGSEQAVPGMAVMFAFFIVGTIGYTFFREHGWGTWSRVRVCGARPIEILLAKVVVPVVALTIQFAILIGLGMVFLDLRFNGSLVVVALLSMSFFVFLVSYSLVLVSYCKTMNQLTTYSTIGALLFGALGGALTTTAALPDWAHHLSPVTPSYWVMRGFNELTLGRGDVGTVAVSIAVLLGMSGLMLALTARRFSFEEPKISF